jgi:hypothetical protein
MNFFTPPPSFDMNVPRFLQKRRILQFLKKAIAWSISEYTTAIEYYRSIGDDRSAYMIQKHLTNAMILSKHPNFRQMCEAVNSEIFNELPRTDRRLLTNAWNASNSFG